ncbi:cadherin repeat domain-containing protein, partial [Vibrio mediterranei]|uniref:cadherin repeat domain-containing protein n=1 Tax=Vibrio mediterranei TaxID=689 RepID=UPI00148BBC10
TPEGKWQPLNIIIQSVKLVLDESYSTKQNFATKPDYEQPTDKDKDNVYQFNVVATDADGNVVSQAMTITVTNVKENVTFSITGLNDVTVAENTQMASQTATIKGQPIGVITWSVNDTTNFAITPSGVLNFVGNLDYETQSRYSVMVTATDSDGNTATQTLVISVTDVKENATFSITGLNDVTVAENAVMAPQTATIKGQPIGVITWSVNDTTNFAITPSGILSFVGTLDFETQNNYSVTVTATDADGNIATQAVIVTVTDIKETATFTITGLNDATVAENDQLPSQTAAINGKPIGTVIWSVNDTTNFAITSAGLLSFIGTLDYDATSSYVVTVTATDSDGNVANKTIHITVKEKPAHGGLTSPGNVNVPFGTAPRAHPVNAVYGGAVTYSSNNAAVTVDASGTLRFVSAGTATITVQEAETANHLAGSVQYTVTVTKAAHAGGDDYRARSGNGESPCRFSAVYGDCTICDNGSSY